MESTVQGHLQPRSLLDLCFKQTVVEITVIIIHILDIIYVKNAHWQWHVQLYEHFAQSAVDTTVISVCTEYKKIHTCRQTHASHKVLSRSLTVTVIRWHLCMEY